MVTTVTGKNQVTIPAPIAQKMGIHRGSRINWPVSGDGKQAELKVLPSRGELARSLLGAGRKYLKPGDDPIAELIAERVREDEERSRCLEGK